jgi:hypothetical protein
MRPPLGASRRTPSGNGVGLGRRGGNRLWADNVDIKGIERREKQNDDNKQRQDRRNVKRLLMTSFRLPVVADRALRLVVRFDEQLIYPRMDEKTWLVDSCKERKVHRDFMAPVSVNTLFIPNIFALRLLRRCH